MTVEELFGRDDAVLPVAAMPVAPLGGTGARVTLAPIGDGYVALPLRGVTVSRHVSTREVQGLLKVLSSAWLLDQLASLPGYDPGLVRGANHDAAAPTLTPVKISFMGALAG